MKAHCGITDMATGLRLTATGAIGLFWCTAMTVGDYVSGRKNASQHAIGGVKGVFLIFSVG